MEKREVIIQAINDKFAEMSTETILFHQALADILGFHITDHRCMHFLHRYGPMPAGRLSEVTGLTTAAVTSIIDRLEQAGYAKRTNDPKDRRKTIVEPIRIKKIKTEFALTECYCSSLPTALSSLRRSFICCLQSKEVKVFCCCSC